MLDKIQVSRPEWRAFTSGDSNNNSRTGTPSSLAICMTWAYLP